VLRGRWVDKINYLCVDHGSLPSESDMKSSTALLHRRFWVVAVAIGAVVASPTFTRTASAAAPVAPIITSPADGSTLCLYDATYAPDPFDPLLVSGTGPSWTQALLYDNGGATAVNVNDPSLVGIDGVWNAGVSSPSLGPHALYATTYDGTTESAPSATVHVTVVRGHPLNMSASVGAISPKNQDGIKDSTVIHMSSAASGTVDLSVADGTGTVVRQAHLQIVAGQGLDWVWDGKNASGAYVPDGPYGVGATWTEDGCQSRFAGIAVSVDNTAPMIGPPMLSSPTLDPRPDYGREIRDTVTMRVAATPYQDGSAPIYTFLLYHAGHAKPFHIFSHPRYVPVNSHVQVTWNGRTPAGALMPAGRYAYQVRAIDDVGNIAVGPRKSFVLSHKRMVRRTTTALGSGMSFTVKEQHNSCGMTTSRHDSRYAGGLLLRYCGKQNRDVSVLVYALRAPKMNKIFSFEPILTGGSPDHNRMAGLLLTFHPKRWFGFRVPATYGTHKWRLPGYQFVSDDGHIYFAVGFAGPGTYDYDIKNLGAKYTYEVFTAS
jgi:flagellar hook assembly protein FlgD